MPTETIPASKLTLFASSQRFCVMPSASWAVFTAHEDPQEMRLQGAIMFRPGVVTPFELKLEKGR